MSNEREYKVEYRKGFYVTYDENGKSIIHHTIDKFEWNAPRRGPTKKEIADLRKRQAAYQKELREKFQHRGVSPEKPKRRKAG